MHDTSVLFSEETIFLQWYVYTHKLAIKLTYVCLTSLAIHIYFMEKDEIKPQSSHFIEKAKNIEMLIN